MKISSERCTFSVLLLLLLFLRVQVLRLNGLTLAALGQTQASPATPVAALEKQLAAEVKPFLRRRRPSYLSCC